MKSLKYQEIISAAIPFFALLIAFWIPLYKYYISLFIIGWVVFSLLNGKLKYNLLSQYSKERMVFFSLQIVFFLIICLGIIISDSKEKALEVVLMKLSFLLFPVLFFLNADRLAKYKDRILKLFIAGNLIASVICLFYGLIRLFNDVGNEQLISNFNVWDSPYLRYNKFSIFHHPAYFSMYLLLSMASMFYLRRKADRTINALGKFGFYSLILYHFLILFLLSSKAGMLIALVLIVREFFLYIKRQKSILIKLLSVFVLLLGIFFFLSNNRIKIALKTTKETYNKGKESEEYPVRLILWESAIELVKDNFWFGVGTGDSKSEFSEKNKNIHYKDSKIYNLNVHNQFLETFMSSGFIGFFALIALIGVGIVRAIKKREELFLIFLLIVILNLLVESMLNTIAGISFIVYFYNYFVFLDPPQINKVS